MRPRRLHRDRGMRAMQHQALPASRKSLAGPVSGPTGPQVAAAARKRGRDGGRCSGATHRQLKVHALLRQVVQSHPLQQFLRRMKRRPVGLHPAVPTLHRSKPSNRGLTVVFLILSTCAGKACTQRCFVACILPSTQHQMRLWTPGQKQASVAARAAAVSGPRLQVVDTLKPLEKCSRLALQHPRGRVSAPSAASTSMHVKPEPSGGS